MLRQCDALLCVNLLFYADLSLPQRGGATGDPRLAARGGNDDCDQFCDSDWDWDWDSNCDSDWDCNSESDSDSDICDCRFRWELTT